MPTTIANGIITTTITITRISMSSSTTGVIITATIVIVVCACVKALEYMPFEQNQLFRPPANAVSRQRRGRLAGQQTLSKEPHNKVTARGLRLASSTPLPPARPDSACANDTRCHNQRLDEAVDTVRVRGGGRCDAVAAADAATRSAATAHRVRV